MVIDIKSLSDFAAEYLCYNHNPVPTDLDPETNVEDSDHPGKTLNVSVGHRI